MVRLKRTTWIEGVKHESYIVLNENEWRVLKANLVSIGKNIQIEEVGFDKENSLIDEAQPDDKPTLEDWERLRVKGQQHFKKEEWDDALYYFEKAFALRETTWVKGRIKKCRLELNPNKDEENKGNKAKRGRKPRKK